MTTTAPATAVQVLAELDAIHREHAEAYARRDDAAVAVLYEREHAAWQALYLTVGACGLGGVDHDTLRHLLVYAMGPAERQARHAAAEYRRYAAEASHRPV